MASSALNLVVIRSPDIDQSAAFYSVLGITFSKHSHGTGPEHYASEGDGVTFEIYPEADSAGTTTATRLGFKVSDLDTLLPILVEKGGRVASPAKDSPWGRRAVVSYLPRARGCCARQLLRNVLFGEALLPSARTGSDETRTR